MEMKKFETNIFAQAQALFTQEEFNKALGEAKAEIMAVAIQSTKQAIAIEREECAKIAHFMQLNDARAAGLDVTSFKSPIAEAIFTRMTAKPQVITDA
jgi:cyanate lyase